MSAGAETTGTAGPAHAAVALLSGLVVDARKAVLMLSPSEIWSCSSGDVEALLRLQAELDSAVTAIGLLAVRDADVRGLAAEDGKASTATWLARKLDLTPGEATSRVKTADMLCRKATDSLDALAEGRVNASQARALAAGLRKIDAVASVEEFDEAQAFLLREGVGLHSGHITRLARHIEEVLDPDGSDERRERAQRERELTITDLGGGRHRIRGFLTDETAALLHAAIDPLAAPRPAVPGPNGEAGERDPRSAAQRRHDALADVVRQFLRFGDLPTSRGVRPHLHVTASIETMRGDTAHPFARTATGEDLDLATLQSLACDAGMTPILTDTLGVPLAMGREVRTVTPAQWAALVARDIGCIGEGCTRPAAWTEAHHITWWRNGGETNVEDMALVCSHEHHLIHHEGWEVRIAADGHPEMIPPRCVDPDQRPRRNAHWQLIRNGLTSTPDEPDRGP